YFFCASIRSISLIVYPILHASLPLRAWYAADVKELLEQGIEWVKRLASTSDCSRRTSAIAGQMSCMHERPPSDNLRLLPECSSS
ncbi:hypothetical protein BDR04DRAFT_1106742, partial [Suillus decipiens]